MPPSVSADWRAAEQQSGNEQRTQRRDARRLTSAATRADARCEGGACIGGRTAAIRRASAAIEASSVRRLAHPAVRIHVLECTKIEEAFAAPRRRPHWRRELLGRDCTLC